MNIDFKNNDRVLLISFNGSMKPDLGTQPYENYWKLIHQKGIVVQDPTNEGLYKNIAGENRLLVRFDKSLESLGLECHNRIKNSLWVKVSDLKRS